MDPASATHHRMGQDAAILSQISALLESAAQLQRSSTLLLAEVARQRSAAGGPHAEAAAFDSTTHQQHQQQQQHVGIHDHHDRLSVVDERPASARTSILMPGAPIPPRGAQDDHSPRQRIVDSVKTRLFEDGWPDNDDTDMHARRLTEAMLRVGSLLFQVLIGKETYRSD